MRLRASLVVLLAVTLTPGLAAQSTMDLRYSVQIASLGSMDVALDAGRGWARPEMPVYVVPVDVQGRTYYRVMAGLLTTRQEAEALMAQLVAQGIKETANAWDVRDTNLAFVLGTHPSEADALRARDDAHARGVPAYVIAAEENGSLAYRTWAGGFSSGQEATVLQDRLTRQGEPSQLVSRRGLSSADAGILATRLAQEEAEQRAAEAAQDPPRVEDPPVEEPPPASQAAREEEAPPEPQPAEPEPTPQPPETQPGREVPPAQTAIGTPAFTRLFVGAMGMATSYVGDSGPFGYGGGIMAGVLLGGIVELGGHGGAEYVSQEGAFGAGTATAVVLSYSGFGGLYTPAIGVGGTSVSVGARGGWSGGQARVTVDDASATFDLETGVFVEPVLKIGSGSLQILGAFRYYLDDTSPADWTGSLGIIWGL